MYFKRNSIVFLFGLLLSSGVIAQDQERSALTDHSVAYEDVTTDGQLYHRYVPFGNSGFGLLEIEHLATGTVSSVLVEPLDREKDDFSKDEPPGDGGATLQYVGSSNGYTTYFVIVNGQVVGVLTINNQTGETHYTILK